MFYGRPDAQERFGLKSSGIRKGLHWTIALRLHCTAGAGSLPRPSRGDGMTEQL